MKNVLLKFILILAISGINYSVRAQSLPEMDPVLGYLVDKSEAKFTKEGKICAALLEKANSMGGYDKLSDSDKQLYDNCEERMENYWDIIGGGCSWYCGGGVDSIYASSELGSSYQSSYAEDNSYKTAWVEGADGDGIGEYLVYSFLASNPRITDIIIVNGYVKSEKIWKENSRVKKLKMYIDDKPFAILNLEDTRMEQTFTFEPIGTQDRDDIEKMSAMPNWTMTFEILEVYKGSKYDHTAITEIYFDGIDVH